MYSGVKVTALLPRALVKVTVHSMDTYSKVGVKVTVYHDTDVYRCLWEAGVLTDSLLSVLTSIP